MGRLARRINLDSMETLMINRRHLLQSALGAGAALGSSSLLPAWARSASDGNLGLTSLSGTQFDLNISQFPVRIGGKAGLATGINGTLPAPLLRLREGDDVTLNVTNSLEEDTSIHWHGLLVPFHMDGVPGVSFPGIKPGETFKYQFKVPQNGTYWYHSHSGLQEQLGHYGPIVIDPAGADPVSYDREYVLAVAKEMKKEYDLSKMKKRRNPYAARLKKQVTIRMASSRDIFKCCGWAESVSGDFRQLFSFPHR